MLDVQSIASEARRQKINMRLDRTVRRTPGNEHVALRDAVGPQLSKIAAKFGLVPPVVTRRRARLFADDLRLINDTLAGTAFGSRYWVWGGMLLGWAREGALIPSDIGDADFGYDARDESLLEEAEAALLAAGFRRWYSFWSNSGEEVEHIFIRHGALFEFYRMTPIGDDSQEYHLYGAGIDGLVEAVAHVPRRGLEPFEFLGRKWLKPLDHEELFTLNYGDWRTPDPDWHYLDDGAVVERREWRPVGAGGRPAR